ncbi:hypothetical protein [Streptomyces sp. NPDC005435]|uniref:DUF6197 family protein n=1 Tax=Streptomyces sp. NPDC005435 TaxID=3154464 RepID=UPI0034550758
MTNTLTPPVTFTDDTLLKAAGLADDAFLPVWTGPSGEQSTGEAVARHLEAAVTLLRTNGWARIYPQDQSGSHLPDNPSMTEREMLQALLALIRDEIGSVPELTLYSALRRIAESDQGDPDTAHIGGEVLNLVVRAHTGTDHARATSWSERLTRTHADITALLTAGARFARTYGPAA